MSEAQIKREAAVHGLVWDRTVGTLPWQRAGGLAPRMRELHAKHDGRNAAHEIGDALHRRFVGVGIKTRAIRRDAAGRRHAGAGGG